MTLSNTTASKLFEPFSLKSRPMIATADSGEFKLTSNRRTDHHLANRPDDD
jgi:hypothetical protein